MGKRKIVSYGKFEWFVMRYAGLIGEDAFKEVIREIREYFKEVDVKQVPQGEGRLFDERGLVTLKEDPRIKELLPVSLEFTQRLSKRKRKVERLQDNSATYEPISLNLQVGDEDGFEIVDQLRSPDVQTELDRQVSFAKLVEDLASSGILLPKELQVLRLRFGIECNSEYTLEEISKMMKLTRERVRQIEAKALRKARSFYKQQKLDESILQD